MNFAKLTQILSLPSYTGLSISAAEVLINTKNIAVKVPISVHDIEAYLTASRKLLAITDSADTAAREAVLGLAKFSSFDTSNPAYLATLTALLDGLVTASLITTTDKTNILAMGDSMISAAEQAGIGIVNAGDIQATGVI